MRLYETESCVKEGEISMSIPIMKTGGEHRLSSYEAANCVVLSFSNQIRSSLLNFFIFINSLSRNEAVSAL